MPAPVEDPALPQSLRIPATGTESELLHLGLREDGTLDVPPEPPGSPASWYTGSPAPGQHGPAVLLGHVNATGGGPGVFADLRSLKPGDLIEVGRDDGTTAVFTVDRGEQYGKDNFPTLEVYGNTDGAELRLITCDGYDPATGEFDDNYVVYAKERSAGG
ncbi:class F sortase [Arthrobacter sp. 7Tela_A1]|uniref:class F sortase n=1 Tax=Arthrobacter sp. 7Tela_A1 TaxID=3093745 RepID=UPI003BB80AFC